MNYSEYVTILRNETATIYLDPSSGVQRAFRYPNTSDVVVCSETFKPCHMHYIDLNWQSVLNLVKLKEKLDSNKQTMYRYIYKGSVKNDLGECIEEQWTAYIKGYSVSHAIKNLIYQYKNENDIPQNSIIHLDHTKCRRCG